MQGTAQYDIFYILAKDQIDDKDSQIAHLNAENEALRRRVEELEARLRRWVRMMMQCEKCGIEFPEGAGVEDRYCSLGCACGDPESEEMEKLLAEHVEELAKTRRRIEAAEDPERKEELEHHARVEEGHIRSLRAELLRTDMPHA